ncbi:MAG: sulfite exporter TauE/SafE family protein [Rubrivivax sp.]|nr:sulfite exporter TauE/SafE family protein [Rubrivivax sp.]
MDATLLWIVVGAACAGFVQGLTGFGFGLVAMSFWAWVLEPQLAAVLAVFGALTGQILAAIRVRRGYDWRLVLPYVAGGLVGLPLGLLLLPHLDAVRFRAAVGALLAIWCPLMLFSARLPRIEMGGRWADAAAGACGGLMGPLGGFTGVIPTLWCTLRRLERDVQRAVIQNFNLTMLATTMAAYLASGAVTRPMLPLMAAVAPALALPALAGMKVYVGISPQAFRTVVLTLLTVSGVAMLANALPRLLG